MKVGILVLTFNNYTDTRECLESLLGLTYEQHEVIVVDNGSSDGSLERLEGEFPQIAFVHTGDNLGYAGGNNRGIEVALERGAQLVWILNNDVVVDRDTLSRLVDAARESPRAGIIGSKVYFHGDSKRLFFAGGRINSWTGEASHIGYREIDLGQYDKKKAVDYVNGCNLLIRRECIEEIGLLDEAFFLYYEETDWAVRARRAGWEVIFVPVPGVWHKIEAGTGWISSTTAYYLTRNRLYFIRKNYIAHLPFALLFSLALNAAFYALPGKWDHLRMCMRGYKDFFAGRMGRLQI
ncbi:MAG: glycosyltransferase family 2 protein [Actinobacteria bacterium]|jgi:GT2 family glycosyltransferase|nr:MAG: glycosyltransferase family 2 protein [Actinomycetota bacterium]